MDTKFKFNPTLFLVAILLFTVGGTGGVNTASAGDHRYNFGYYSGYHHAGNYSYGNRHSYGHNYRKKHYYNRNYRHNYPDTGGYGNHSYHRYQKYQRHYYQPRPYYDRQRYYQPYYRNNYRYGHGSSGYHQNTLPLVIFGAITLGHILHHY